jgi:ketosteroid isomerase-like protein
MAHRSTEEAEIRQRIDKLVEAIRAMDIESVMRIYAPSILSFDIEPPLQHVGAQAKKTNWANLFRCTSVRSTMRFATSPALPAMTWRSGTASFGCAAH